MKTAANRCCSAVGMHGARSTSCGRRAAKGCALSLAEGKETRQLGEACEKRAGQGGMIGLLALTASHRYRRHVTPCTKHATKRTKRPWGAVSESLPPASAAAFNRHPVQFIRWADAGAAIFFPWLMSQTLRLERPQELHKPPDAIRTGYGILAVAELSSVGWDARRIKQIDNGKGSKVGAVGDGRQHLSAASVC